MRYSPSHVQNVKGKGHMRGYVHACVRVRACMLCVCVCQCMCAGACLMCMDEEATACMWYMVDTGFLVMRYW